MYKADKIKFQRIHDKYKPEIGLVKPICRKHIDDVLVENKNNQKTSNSTKNMT